MAWSIQKETLLLSLFFSASLYLYYLITSIHLFISTLYNYPPYNFVILLTSFLHLIFIDLISAQFNTACPSRLHQPTHPSNLVAGLVNCPLPTPPIRTLWTHTHSLSLLLLFNPFIPPCRTKSPTTPTLPWPALVAPATKSLPQKSEVCRSSISLTCPVPVHPISRFSPANSDAYPGQPPIPFANLPSLSIIKAARSTTRPGRPTGTNNAGSKIPAAPNLGGW